MSKKLKVICPHCKKNFNYYDSTFRPFCSERCKMVDLGEWLSGGYGIPLERDGEPEEQDELDSND